MAVWPASLPQSLPLELTETRMKGFIRTKMDAGPHKQRARFTAVSRYFTCRNLLLTKAQRQTFDTFYADTLGEGGDEFDFFDPVDMTTQSFRFTSPPSYVPKSGDSGGASAWSVSFNVEQLP